MVVDSASKANRYPWWRALTSRCGSTFLDACLLEPRLGAADFSGGKVFSPVGEGELTTGIEGTKVFVATLGKR